MTTIEALKVVFVSSALAVAGLTGWLLHLSVVDLHLVQREKVNGAIQFMTLDNTRHQAALFTLSILMVGCAVLTLELQYEQAPFYLKQILPVLTFISVGGLVDAACTFRRRAKMAELVGAHLQAAIKGGRRSTDPPAEP